MPSESLCSPCSQEGNEQREVAEEPVCCRAGKETGKGEGEWEVVTVAGADSPETELTGSESHGSTA